MREKACRSRGRHSLLSSKARAWPATAGCFLPPRTQRPIEHNHATCALAQRARLTARRRKNSRQGQLGRWRRKLLEVWKGQ